MTPQKPIFDMTYLIGLIASLLSFGLILLTLYMVPALLFGLKYSVPGFLIIFREYFVSELNISETGAAMLVTFIFIILILVLGYVSYRFENKIERQEIFEQTGEKLEELEEKQQVHIETDVDRAVEPPSPHFAGRLIVLAILIALGLFFLHWLISS